MYIVNKLTTFDELSAGSVFIDEDGTVCMKLITDASYVDNAVILSTGQPFKMRDTTIIHVPNKASLIIE